MISTAFRLTNKYGRIWVVVLGAACFSLFAQQPAPDTTSKEFLGQCRSNFARVDEAIAKAGAAYAGYHRIRGFPYLRSDRMLASFVDKVNSFEAFDAWTYELRENDGFARSVELANMGMPDVERSSLLTDLRLCAVWLSNMELADETVLKQVYEEARPPGRVIPTDPAGMHALDRIVRHQQAAIKADFADRRDLPAAAFTRWYPKQVTHSTESPQLLPDPLGRIGHTATDWQMLAEKFAPNWLIETAGSFDSIGAPAWSGDGQAVIDPDRHVVYYTPSYAHVRGHTLVQIAYFVWFSARTATQPERDPLAGNIDGLVWRVTLDPAGDPLLFDVMHMSGFDQIWFAPSAITTTKAAVHDEDPVLVAQTVDPKPGMTVLVHSGSHNPWRVVDESKVGQPAGAQPYELARYDDLMTLPLGDGRTKSFFDSRGIVPGTERTASIPNAGLPNAGAMREWGNQPTAITGRHYFDDPGLIDRFFIVPMVKQEASERHEELEPVTLRYER